MGRVSQWAVRRPWYALATWVGIMVVVGVLGTRFGGDYNDNFELPGHRVDDRAGPAVRAVRRGAGTGAGLDGQVVWKPESGKATEGPAASDHEGAADRAVHVPRCGVRASRRSASRSAPACPQQPAGQGQQGQGSGQGQQGGGAGRASPQLSPEAQGALAHFGQAGVSPDGTVAYATVTFEGKTFDDLNTARRHHGCSNLVKAQNGEDGLQVGANGVFGFVGGEPPSSESIGVTVALVILLFAFGSILGAFLPIVSAALSVALATASCCRWWRASSTWRPSRRSSPR